MRLTTGSRAAGVDLISATLLALPARTASARTREELRWLCYTMRDDKSDCTRPYQRCLKTGVLVTPQGRVFKATK